ncbi:MAG: MFS transporter [Streptosporangiales bacterium]|nr:MFS transporter [Streptosporangiales bacterium]
MNSPGPTDNAPEEPGTSPRNVRKVVAASLVGTTIEWYDYFAYGTAAALVFPKLFFPDFSPIAGTLASFATFSVGFIARPVGGAAFGHFGDRIGRKTMLVVTLMLMGVATVLIGLLPTYAQIGAVAPFLLVVLRFAQGVAVGGEWGGAVLMAVEHSPRKRRGFNGSWPQVGVPAGLLLSTGVFSVASSLPEQAFLSWGWRVPFLASAVLVLVGLLIRLQIMESPVFLRMQQERSGGRIPLVDLFVTHWRGVLLCVGTRIGTDVSFYVHAVYSLSYVTTNLGLPKSVALNATLIAAALEIVTIPVVGRLSDRFGRRPVMMVGAVLLAAWALPFFLLLETRSALGVTLAIVVGLAVAQATVYAPMGTFYAELFAPRVRYSGISVGYQVAGVFGGGLAPIIATALYAATNGYPAISVYIALTAALTLLCVWLGRALLRHNLAHDEVATARSS